MSIIFTLPAPTVYDESPQRIIGWHHVGVPKLVAAELTDVVPRLKELGIRLILSSDLDEQCARVLARKLDCPNKLWKELRRFNWGKMHGQRAAKGMKMWQQMQDKWKDNPTIPVPGGDSLASYQKRMNAAHAKLIRLKGKITLVVARPQEIRTITGLNGNFDLHKLYEWRCDGEVPRPFKAVQQLAT